MKVLANQQSYPTFLSAEEMNSPDKAEKIWKSIEDFFKNEDLARNELRVSFSAFLRISRIGLYPLIESSRRPMDFGPFGGVYKFRDNARVDFDSWFFNPEETREENDLSGFIPAYNLRKIVDWFCSGKDRETAVECLTRELNEELEEIGLPELKPKIANLKFRPVRTTWHKPKQVPDQSFHVFRIVDVMTLVDGDVGVEDFVNSLFERIAESNLDEAAGQSVILATHKEIDNCRSRLGLLIGTHTQYLFHGLAEGPEPPPVQERTLKNFKKRPVERAVAEVVLPNRVSTGSVGLDRLLLGGVPEKYACVLASAVSDERELLVRNFLEVGLERGETTFYVTSEAKSALDLAEKFQSNFFLFVCNPRVEVVLESLPNVFKLKGVDNLTDICIALTKGFRRLNQSQLGPRRACVEIVSDVLLEHKVLLTRKWLIEVLSYFRSNGFTTLAVVDSQMHPDEEVQAVLGLFDGEIRISEKETGRGREKTLSIKRLNNQRFQANEIALAGEQL